MSGCEKIRRIIALCKGIVGYVIGWYLHVQEMIILIFAVRKSCPLGFSLSMECKVLIKICNR